LIEIGFDRYPKSNAMLTHFLISNTNLAEFPKHINDLIHSRALTEDDTDRPYTAAPYNLYNARETVLRLYAPYDIFWM